VPKSWRPERRRLARIYNASVHRRICFFALAQIGIVLFSANAAQATEDPPWTKAHNLETAGNIRGAWDEMQKTLALDAKNADYLAYTGHLEFSLNEFDASLQHAQAALAIKNEPWYTVLAARAAQSGGRFDLSLGLAKKAELFGIKTLGEANYQTVQDIIADFEGWNVKIDWQIAPDKFLADGKNFSVLLAVPQKDLPYQTTRIELSAGEILQDLDLRGNRHLKIRLLKKEPLFLTTYVTRKAQNLFQKLEEASKQPSLPIPDDLKDFLKSSEKVNLEGETLQKVAKTLKVENRIQTVRAILQWMQEKLSYKVSTFSNAEEVVVRGYGECWAWSSVFTALARLSGIPARNVWGPTNYPGFALPGHLKGHTWAEFFDPQLGWVPIEPQYPLQLGLLPHHYIRVSHSDPELGWGPVMNLPDMMKFEVLK
jgi:hypothetical protein